MFANEVALRTLVESDTTASKDEKNAVIGILTRGIKGEGSSMSGILDDGRVVVSFKEAAKALGYKGPSAIYRAIHLGVLDGYYGGGSGYRATGVLVESIRNRILNRKSSKGSVRHTRIRNVRSKL